MLITTFKLLCMKNLKNSNKRGNKAVKVVGVGLMENSMMIFVASNAYLSIAVIS